MKAIQALLELIRNFFNKKTDDETNEERKEKMGIALLTLGFAAFAILARVLS